MNRTIPKPSKEELLIAFHTSNYQREKVAANFNVSGNLVRKWCNSYGFRCQDKKTLDALYTQEILGKEIKEIIKRPKKYKVAQIDPITDKIMCIYESIAEAALKMGCCGQAIQSACNKPNRLSAGYKWIRVN